MVSNQPLDRDGRCIYSNCKNESSKNKLFKFPSSTEPRYKIWLKNAGCEYLLKMKKQVRKNAVICGEHFHPKWFVTAKRLRLTRDAIPRPFSAKNAKQKTSLSLGDGESRVNYTNCKDTVTELIEISSEDDEIASNSETSKTPTTSVVVTMENSLPEIKRSKIEKQIPEFSELPTIEKSTDPENCPVSGINNPNDATLQPHSDKVSVDETNEIKSLESTVRSSIPAEGGGKPFSGLENHRESSKQSDENNTKDVTETNEITESIDDLLKENDINDSNMTAQINNEDESSNISRCSETAESNTSRFNWDTIQKARAASVSVYTTEIENTKRSSSIDLIHEYYRAQDEKSLKKCAYINCKNTKLKTGAHLFRFPRITDPRLATWVENTGNPRILYSSWTTIRRAGLCGDHFTDDCFYDGSRQRLLRTAFPKPFYLDKHFNVNDKNDDEISQNDLSEIFRIIDNEIRAEDLEAWSEIDSLDEDSEKLKKFELECSAELRDFSDSENGVKSSILITKDEEVKENFTRVTVESKSIDRKTDNEVSSSSFDNESLTEPDDPPDDASVIKRDDYSECNDNIRKILALAQQKAQFCKLIERYSRKLKNTTDYKKQLRSQLATLQRS